MSRKRGERAAAVPGVTPKSVGTDLVSSGLTECSRKLPEALLPILLERSESAPPYYFS